MHIELASKQDLGKVMDLYHEAAEAMEGTLYDCCWREGIHPTSEFVESLILGEGLLVVRDGETIVGAVGIDHDLGHDYGSVSWLVDVPDDCLDATANNAPAIALYASEGFSIVAEGNQEIGPDDDPYVPFVVMERTL